MITLYQFGNSVCCQKVRIVLAEKRLVWKPVEINLFLNEQYSIDYLKLNPTGVVPTLVQDDHVVIESTLVCEYLNDVYPDPPLMPATPIGRAHARRWSKIVDEGLHEGVGSISFSAMFRERMRAMTPEQREARYSNVGDPKRGDLFRQTYEHGTRAKQVVQAVAAFERMFSRLEDTLKEGGPWIMGHQPTLADVGLMPYVARLDYLGLLDLWIAKMPNVAAWWGQAQAWPSFRAGVTEPMNRQEAEEMRAHGPIIRESLRQTLAEQREATLALNAGASGAPAA